jgi:hypothetical protein
MLQNLIIVVQDLCNHIEDSSTSRRMLSILDMATDILRKRHVELLENEGKIQEKFNSIT